MKTYACLFLAVLSCYATAQIPLDSCIIIDYASKISATQGGWTPSFTGTDHFGEDVTAMEDTDGDGFTEIAVGVPMFNAGSGVRNGAVYILDIDAGGNVVDHTLITNGSGGFTSGIADDDRFGTTVSMIGDLDGNGVNELAIGAPYSDVGGNATGTLWILFLNNNHQVIAQQRIDNANGNLGVAMEVMGRFGFGAASIGDLNGDSVPDLAVGQHSSDDGGTDKGSMWILMMNANGTVQSATEISETEGGLGYILQPIEYFGTDCTYLGDIDQDGKREIAVGSPRRGTSTSSSCEGSVYIISLNTDGSVYAASRITNGESGLGNILSPNDHFGQGVHTLGDLNGNGLIELLVGTWNDDDGNTDAGAAYILEINTSGNVVNTTKISELSNLDGLQLDDQDHFGRGVTVFSDMNGDGLMEFAIGAREDDDGGADLGAIHIFSLRDSCSIGDTITGIHAGNTPLARIYPNPVQQGGVLNILISGPRTDLEVYNTSGALVHQLRVAGGHRAPNEVGLPSGLKPGIYFIKILSGNRMAWECVQVVP